MRRILSILIALCLVRSPVLGASAPQATQGSIRGEVRDSTGGALADAQLTLTNRETGQTRLTTTAPNGSYVFIGLRPGRYRLKADRSGFVRAERELDVTLDADLWLTVTLPLAAITQQVKVTASAPPLGQPSMTSLGRTITSVELETLPLPTAGAGGFLALAPLAPGILPAPVVNSSVSNYSTAAQGSGSNTQLVDGVSTDGLGLSGGPPASAVREFKAVSNQFGAQFGQASGAVLNIVTRSGSNTAAGRLNVFLQNSRWNATSAVARRAGANDQRSDQQSATGFLSGPVVKDRAFLLGAMEHTAIDSLYVNASPVALLFRRDDPLVMPVRVRIPKPFVRVDVNLARSDALTVTYNYQGITNDNAAREDLSALERGRRLTDTSHDLTVLHTHVFGQAAVNELRLKGSRNRFARSVDGFCGGCATLNYQGALLLGKPANDPQLRVTDRGDIASVLTVVSRTGRGQQEMTAGVQASVVDMSTDQPANFIGTYVFPTPILFDPTIRDSYPSQFTQNVGDPRTRLRETIASGFIQDIWRVNRVWSVNGGLRWDRTTFPGPSRLRTDTALRLGLAVSPWPSGRTIFRAAAGRFYDEISLNVVRDAATHFVTRTIRNPGYQGDMRIFDPRAPSLRGGRLETFSTSDWGETRTPYSDQISAGVQHQIGRDLAITADLVRALGRRLLIRRDVNYPDPTTHVRPDRELLQKNVVETTAHSWYAGLQAGVEKRWSARHSFSVAYTWATSENDTDGPTSSATDQHNILADRGPTANDARHRISAAATIELPGGFRMAGVLTASSALPYNVTSGTDDNLDGVNNDRAPGHTRNDARGAASVTLDLRIARPFQLGRKRFELLVEAFNATNHSNWTSYQGNYSRRETFGIPADAGPPRQIQIGLRFGFR